jgi:hypothetical protein
MLWPIFSPNYFLISSFNFVSIRENKNNLKVSVKTFNFLSTKSSKAVLEGVMLKEVEYKKKLNKVLTQQPNITNNRGT